MVSKIGVTSLLIGLILFFGMWYFIPFQGGAVPLIQSFVNALIIMIEGGLMILGLFLIIVGILMLVL